MAGAQAAQACTEPALGDIRAHGTEQKLVRFKLTGLTPGSEYVLRVDGRERKSGTVTEDRLSRRFRMPKLGDERRRVTVEVVVDNEACDNGPWKFTEKITYLPAPEPVGATPTPAPSPTPTPTPAPQASPSPPSAPSPPPAPSITKPAPNAQPAVPQAAIPKAATPKAVTPAPAVPKAEKPQGRGWVTPADPYQTGENASPRIDPTRLSRTDLPSDSANSAAALFGLAGAFLVLVGIVTMGWNRFRRYDEARLEEIFNPEGKLPTHLDPEANDMRGAEVKEPGRLVALVRRRRRPSEDAATGAPAARGPRKGGRGGKKGAAASLDPEVRAKMTDEEFEEYKTQFKRKGRIAAKGRRRAALPTLDPTASDAPGGPVAPEHGPKKYSKPAQETKRKLFRRGKGSPGTDQPVPSTDQPAPSKEQPAFDELSISPEHKPLPLPAFDPTASDAPGGPTGVERGPMRHKASASGANAPAAPENADKAPAKEAAPAGDGQGAAPEAAKATNGRPAPDAAEPVLPASTPAQPSNGHPPAPTHREQVESELQRILNDAGLHAEVEGILAEAKAEAERQGIPIDSDLMLRALCEDVPNGAARLSDAAKGELESRFKRIAAEERGEARPAGS